MVEDFSNLIDKYIKEDDKEKLLDLASKYENKINLDKIVNYYIKDKDVYYICELLSIVSEFLDLDNVFNKIIESNDETFIFLVSKNGLIQNIIDYKYILKLNKFLDK